jgi:hypothetical protein
MPNGCSNCLYGQTFTEGRNPKRLCRHNAPNPAMTGSIANLWATVDDNDWCGQGADVTTGAPFGAVVYYVKS